MPFWKTILYLICTVFLLYTSINILRRRSQASRLELFGSVFSLLALFLLFLSFVLEQLGI